MSGGVFCVVCELTKTLGSLHADGQVCVPVLFVVWLRHPVLGAAGIWVELRLGFR